MLVRVGGTQNYPMTQALSQMAYKGGCKAGLLFYKVAQGAVQWSRGRDLDRQINHLGDVCPSKRRF